MITLPKIIRHAFMPLVKSPKNTGPPRDRPPVPPRPMGANRMKQYGIYNTKFGHWAFDSKYDVYVFENINIARAQAEALWAKHIQGEFEVREFPED